MDDLDRQADELLDYCSERGIAPTPENLSQARAEMNEYADRLIDFCHDHGVPPTPHNLRMALGVLRALAQNVEER